MSSRQPRPYVSMPVVFVAIGGIEYAAIVTDARQEGVSLTTFPPGGAPTYVSRIPFKASASDLRPKAEPPFCYFVQPPSSGYLEPAVPSQHQTNEAG